MRGRPAVPSIYAIADAEALAPRRIAAAVGEMAAAGVRWIQVRAKRMAGTELHDELERACEVAARAGAELWIDDRADLAALLPVAGLHLGQEDLPAAVARRVVGRPIWIGCSTHDAAQAAVADADPAIDLLAIGPIFATRGKRAPDPVVGLEGLRAVRRQTGKPLVAIGGIGPDNVASVLAAGADGAAAIGAVSGEDIRGGCERLLRAAEGSACP